jgi:hypothetical protein
MNLSSDVLDILHANEANREPKRRKIISENDSLVGAIVGPSANLRSSRFQHLTTTQRLALIFDIKYELGTSVLDRNTVHLEKDFITKIATLHDVCGKTVSRLWSEFLSGNFTAEAHIPKELRDHQWIKGFNHIKTQLEDFLQFFL